MAGYDVGEQPPALEEDGSFLDAVTGARVYSVVNEAGEILVVDQQSGLLAVSAEGDE